MRTIGGLAIPKDTDLVKFPDSTIINETDTVVGTPVVREIYGDILTNIYKILRLTGVTATGTEDSETSQYQIVDALKKWTNDLNDKEQVLSLNTLVWSVPFDLDILPDKYVFIARASDDYNVLESYTFKGTGVAPTYPLTSTGFSASDELLVIIDQSGVRVLSLTQIASAQTQTFNLFGQPLAFNDTALMAYDTDGSILRDEPKIDDLRASIRSASTDPLAEIMDMVILKGKILCFTFLPNTTTYKFYQFNVASIGAAANVPVSGIVIPIGSDNEPYMYTDGTDVWLTNTAGTLADDKGVSKLSYDETTPTLTFVNTVTLDSGFVKTTNVVIQGDFLYTFVNSDLQSFHLPSGTQGFVGDFKTIIGQMFNFNGAIYYTNGEVSNKWSISPGIT